jgi:N-acetylglutamate synthase-like GNAT family acetyltransferase
MSMPQVHFRPARPVELDALTNLALRSKAHWGYDAAFMEACREELTISHEHLTSASFEVMELDGCVMGLYALEPPEGDPGPAELDLFFLEPACMGRGLGRVMMNRALARARQSGFRRLLVQSDPHAEAFYAAMGFTRVGVRPSDSIAGRVLPVMERSLEGGP